MLQSESLRTITLANGSHSDDRLGRLTMENGECSLFVSSTKYKRRKVSAVRDFPLGCGPFVQRISLRPTEDTDAASTDTLQNSISKKGISDGPKNGTSDSLKDLIQVGVATPKEEVVPFLLDDNILLPPNGPIAVSDGNVLENSVARKYPPRRRVSAIREFPPFCGRNAPCLSKEEAVELNKSFGQEKSESGLDDKTVTEAVKMGVRQTLVKEGDAQGGDLVTSQLATNCAKVTRDLVRLKDFLKNQSSDQEKSKMDDKPLVETVKTDVKQTAGAVRPKESLDVLASLKRDSIEKSGPGMDDKHLTEIINVDMKLTHEDFLDGCSCNSDLEGSGSKVVKDKVKCQRKDNAMEEMRKEDEYVISSKMKVVRKERENCNEPPFEDKLYWWDHEFETVVGKGNGDDGDLDENLCKEIIVYSEDKSPNQKFSDTSQNKMQVVDLGSLGSDRVIVLGLMAASNCPWRQGKGACKSKSAAGRGSQVKKLDFRSPVERPKTTTTVRKKVDRSDSKGKSLKKTPPEAACQSKGQLVIWNRDNSAEHIEYEDFHVAPISRGVDVFVPPLRHGILSSKDHDNDANVTRNEVRETLRLFQAVCRKLLQEEEAKSKLGKAGHRRVDCQAAKILKDKNKYVNTGKQILGAVPGVEVGDEFQYRVELNIIGLHRQTQGGIDYLKRGEKILATSIVASGGYADDLDNSDVLIYTGQGGNVINSDKEPEDQRLERGNLALKNSMHEKNPVRVICGFDSSEGKSSKTYVYDGLYLVENFWQDVGPHGKLVFKFQLERIPGQPELAWREVKKSKKCKEREGVCVDDISEGKEVIPICAVNTIDDEKPPPFKYITSLIYPDWYHPTTPRGCNCITGCSDSEKCSCAVKNGGEIPFNYNGAIVEAKPIVYECGPSCKCPPSCHNRVSQHSIKFQLEIFKTKSRGWGVRSLNFIPSGSFICEYIGELLKEKEAEERTGNDEYLFDIGNNYNDSSLWDGLLTLMPDLQSSSSDVVGDGSFTIDAAQYGNVGRFVNHSCTPNLYAQNVLYDHEDKRIPHIMLFAAENIPPLQELTYHYNYMIDQVRDSNGNIKKKSCFCGSHECTGRLY